MQYITVLFSGDHYNYKQEIVATIKARTLDQAQNKAVRYAFAHGYTAVDTIVNPITAPKPTHAIIGRGHNLRLETLGHD